MGLRRIVSLGYIYGIGGNGCSLNQLFVKRENYPSGGKMTLFMPSDVGKVLIFHRGSFLGGVSGLI